MLRAAGREELENKTEGGAQGSHSLVFPLGNETKNFTVVSGTEEINQTEPKQKQS